MKPNENLTPHFKLGEFLSKNSMEGVTPTILANLRRLAEKLEEVRELLGNRPMRITSGFRTVADHYRIYREMGVTNKARIPMGSHHLNGTAADFMVDGMTSAAVRKILDPVWQGGMELGVVHNHLDLGPRRRFYPK